jgi:hypothetical protein
MAVVVEPFSLLVLPPRVCRSWTCHSLACHSLALAAGFCASAFASIFDLPRAPSIASRFAPLVDLALLVRDALVWVVAFSTLLGLALRLLAARSVVVAITALP